MNKLRFLIIIIVNFVVGIICLPIYFLCGMIKWVWDVSKDYSLKELLK